MSSPNYINIDDLTINNNNITKEEQIYKIGLLNQGTIKYTIKKEKICNISITSSFSNSKNLSKE